MNKDFHGFPYSHHINADILLRLIHASLYRIIFFHQAADCMLLYNLGS